MMLSAVVVLLLPGCATPEIPAPAAGTPVDLAIVQLYAQSARIRLLVGEVPLEGEDPFREPATRTSGIGAHALTLRWPDGATQTLSDLVFSRGPDVYFESPIARTGFHECSFRAVVLDGRSNASREFAACGVQREHFVGIGDLGLADGRGNVTIRVWRAPEGRIADWGNGTVQHAPREMTLVEGIDFAAWRLDIGEGRVVDGEGAAEVAPGVYRFEFAAEDRLDVGIGDLSFEATLPDGRRITDGDVDLRLVAP